MVSKTFCTMEFPISMRPALKKESSNLALKKKVCPLYESIIIAIILYIRGSQIL
jgi:hypothetical protein